MKSSKNKGTSVKRKSNKKVRSTHNKITSKEGKKIPNVVFKTRVRDKKLLKKKKTRKNPFRWKNVKSNDIFKNKKIIIFSLPGAYTPTCSSTHLPDYEKKYKELKKMGIDEVYCLSVNDAFVMFNWGKKLKIKNVKLIPDGNADFTKKMNALVKKNNLGFGDRSWRYSMYVNNGTIEKIFCEEGCVHNCSSDPFKVSDVETMIRFLKKNM